MKNVTITEATGFMPGGVQQMLLNMGVPPTVASAPGVTPVVYKTQMTDAQIEHFRHRGFSHKLEVEETPVVDPRDLPSVERMAQVLYEESGGSYADASEETKQEVRDSVNRIYYLIKKAKA